MFEFSSANFVKLLKQYGLKSNIIATREFRKSKGSGIAEACVRRFRMYLETVFHEYKSDTSFRQKLSYAEKACNQKTNAGLKMSAKDALLMRPLDVMAISNSLRLKRRKFLKKELNSQREILLGTIVRIRIFVSKSFASVVKESYGRLSPYFVVISIDKTRDIYSYRLCDIFTFKPLSGSYSRAELKISKISLFEACDMEEKRVKKIIEYKDGNVFFQAHYRGHVFCAQKSFVK